MGSLEELLDCRTLTREQANEVYLEVLGSKNSEAQRKLCRTDLFYLLTVACKRRDVDRDWLYARCREVQEAPDGFLDLWAREHYKSTIITFGKSIQDLLLDPETTIGIFSHTRPIAKGFLGQIKAELEQNVYLKALFPDVLYQNPQTESPKWALDGGIRVRRKTNPNAESVEAWGLVDGQPTSKHFKRLVYDDVVTLESVSTPEQIAKTTNAWAMSINLGAAGGSSRTIGTRYHMNDTYKAMMDRGSVTPRVYPATSDGTMEGAPVFLSAETLQKKRRDMGPYVFGSQMLENPVADKAMSFKPEWLKYYDTLGDTRGWNLYLLADPANAKKKTSDYTVQMVVGLAPDQNYYLIAAVRDRMNLTQRTGKLFEFHREHMPKKTGYEQYGMQADTQHIAYVQEEKNYRFSITELGGQMPKPDRIKRLIPVFEQGRMWLPKRLPFIDGEGRTVDFIEKFLADEYLAFPVCEHDDMLDCLARILDPELGAEFPKLKPKPKPQYSSGGASWMG
jgi:predicted phage terminase large subunit-like protein